MKKLLFVLAFIFHCFIFSQIGIGTHSPTTMLDVDGDVRIRTIPVQSTFNSSQDYVLMTNAEGNVYKCSAADLPPSNSSFDYIKGNAIGAPSILSVNLISGWRRIAFDTLELDSNNSGNYDISTYEFTAPAPGIYHIYVHFLLSESSLLSVGVNVGVGIFKKTPEREDPVLLAEDTTTLLEILTIKVTPNMRQVQTLTSLNEGDKIFFGAQLPIGITALSASVTGNFFTIMRVK